MTTTAGWYDDGSGRQRWWDGHQWTDRMAGAPEPPAPPPPAAPPPPPAPRARRSRKLIWLLVAAVVLVGAGVAAFVLLPRDSGPGPASVADLQAVTFDDPGGRASDEWAASVVDWLSSGDATACGLGSVHDFAKGPRAEEFGSGFAVLYVEDGSDGEAPRAACDVRVRDDEDRRAFLVSAELFPDAAAALADWDSSVGGANDDGEQLKTYRRSDTQPFLSGTIWVSCWNDFDGEDEERNCNAHWFYDGVLLEGELSSGLDPDPTPQQAADWFAAALPGVVGSAG